MASGPPSHSSQPTHTPSSVPSVSAVPTKNPTPTPTSKPTNPTPSPVGGMTIHNRVYDSCVAGDVPLVGVAVTLYNAFGGFVGETVSDSDGYYTFTGLPFGRYRTEIDYPECIQQVTQQAKSSSLNLLSTYQSPLSKPSYDQSISGAPTPILSASPSTSAYPSVQESQTPFLSFLPTAVPTKNPTPDPTSKPTPSLKATTTIHRQAHDPCVEGDSPLVGATVNVYNVFGDMVGQTVTDNDGYYTFSGLPMGRYRTEIDYPDCDRRDLSNTEHAPPSLLTDDYPIKFYQHGDFCDISFSSRSEEAISAAGFTQFDTLDECCANMFWHDIGGCFLRSHVAFQFEFCVDFFGMRGNSNCPLDEIRAIKAAMQEGLGNKSELGLLEFGNTMLTSIGGEMRCIGPAIHEDLLTNQLRGLVGHEDTKLSICGVVMTKETGCRDELCLRNTYDKVVGPFQEYFYSGEFKSVLRSSPGNELHPALGLQKVEVVASSFTTRKLLLPSTVPTEDEATSLEEYSSTTSSTPRFYPTFLSNQLCHSKTIFDSWEQSYVTLEECCKAHFSWDFETCCSSLNMGGC